MAGRRNYHVQGAISPRAVNVFKDRMRDDLSRWKLISDAELARREKMLPVAMPIWDELQRHQKVCAVLGARIRKMLFLNDTGTGKTFLALALMAYFAKAGISRTSLVLVPNTSNKGEWGKQIKKHAPFLNYVILGGSTEDRWRQLQDNPTADLFIDTYGGFVRMGCDLKEVKRRRKNKAASDAELVLNRTKVKKLSKIFDGLYADESTFLANEGVLAYRICRQILKDSAVAFLLAAKPFGRDPIMLHPQAKMVDGGYALGETQGLFRAAFYDATAKYWGGTDWKLKKGAREEISRFLDDISISYPANEADLPTVVPDIVELEMPLDADTYVEQCREQLRSAAGEKTEMKNAFLRMRQISSGFIGYKDDESGERASFVFKDNPKLDWLADFVDKMHRGPATKTLIIQEFHFTAHTIEKMLIKKKAKFVMLNGMEGEKRNAIALDRYQEDPEIEFMVLSNAAGGYGLNLQMTRNAIHYESAVPVILRYQIERRYNRQFSLHDSVNQYDLVVKGTSDQSILNFHKEGKGLWKHIMNDKPAEPVDKKKKGSEVF